MQRNQQTVSANGNLLLMIVLCNAVIMERGLVSSPGWYYLLYITVPLFLLSLTSFRKKIF